MHVALVHYRILLNGGLETRLFNYIRYLTEAGHEVTVIVSKVGRDVQIPDGINLVIARHLKLIKPLRYALFEKWLERHFRNHPYDFVLSLGRFGAVDTVLAPGNHLGWLRVLGSKGSGYRDRIQTRLDTKAYHNARLILAASEMMRREVIELYGTNPEKVKVLFPPIDPNRFHVGLKNRQAEFREKYGFSRDKRSFLFVSSGHKRKGLPLLLKIFRLLEDEAVELLVAGSGGVPSDRPNVKYLGYVAQTEEIYAAADFTIHPSIYEPFGQVVPESILCNTPVIISHMVGAAEVIGPREGIVVDGFNPEIWADKIVNLDPEDFQIDPNFAEQKEIRLEDHMEKMMRLRGI